MYIKLSVLSMTIKIKWTISDLQRNWSILGREMYMCMQYKSLMFKQLHQYITQVSKNLSVYLWLLQYQYSNSRSLQYLSACTL